MIKILSYLYNMYMILHVNTCIGMHTPVSAYNLLKFFSFCIYFLFAMITVPHYIIIYAARCVHVYYLCLKQDSQTIRIICATFGMNDVGIHYAKCSGAKYIVFLQYLL